MKWLRCTTRMKSVRLIFANFQLPAVTAWYYIKATFYQKNVGKKPIYKPFSVLHLTPVYVTYAHPIPFIFSEHHTIIHFANRIQCSFPLHAERANNWTSPGYKPRRVASYTQICTCVLEVTRKFWNFILIVSIFNFYLYATKISLSRGYTSDFCLALVIRFCSDFVVSPARQGGYTCDKFWRQIEARGNRILQETWAL